MSTPDMAAYLLERIADFPPEWLPEVPW